MKCPAGMTLPEFKLACLRRIAQATGISDEARGILVNLVYTYLPLDVAADQQFAQLLEAEENTGVQKIELTYFGKLERKARKEGRQEGMRAALERQLTHKFGELPPPVQRHIATLTDETELQRLLDLLLDAPSLGEFEREIRRKE